MRLLLTVMRNRMGLFVFDSFRLLIAAKLRIILRQKYRFDYSSRIQVTTLPLAPQETLIVRCVNLIDSAQSPGFPKRKHSTNDACVRRIASRRDRKLFVVTEL